MYVLPLSLVAISTIIAKKASGSWFSPASFFGLMWFLFHRSNFISSRIQ